MAYPLSYLVVIVEASGFFLLLEMLPDHSVFFEECTLFNRTTVKLDSANSTFQVHLAPRKCAMGSLPNVSMCPYLMVRTY